MKESQMIIRELGAELKKAHSDIKDLEHKLMCARREVEEIRDSKLTIKEVLEDHGGCLEVKQILRTYVGSPNGITVIIAK